MLLIWSLIELRFIICRRKNSAPFNKKNLLIPPNLAHGIRLLLLGSTVSTSGHHAADAEASTSLGSNGRRSLRIVMGLLLLNRLTGHGVDAIGLGLLLLRRGAGPIHHHHAGLSGGGVEGMGLHHLLGRGFADAVAVQVLHLGEGAAGHADIVGRAARTARLGGTLLGGLLLLVLGVHGQLGIDGLLVDVVEVDEGLESLGNVVDSVGGGVGGNNGGRFGILSLGGSNILLLLIILLRRLLVVLGLLLSRRLLVVLLLLQNGLGRGGKLLSLGGRLLVVLLLGRGLSIVLLLLDGSRSAGRKSRDRGLLLILLLSRSVGGTVQTKDIAGNVIVGRSRGGLRSKLIELRLRRDGGIEQCAGLVHKVLPGSIERGIHEIVGRRGRRGRGRGDLGGDRVHPALGLVGLDAAGPGVLLLDGEAVVVVGLLSTGTGTTSRGRTSTAALVLDHALGVTAAGLDAELVDLGKGEEAHAVQEQLELLETRAVAHGRGGIRDNLEHVVAAHGPAGLELAAGRLAHGEVHLLAVHEDEALAAGEGPDEGDLVLLAAAVGAGPARGDGLLVGEAEAPADPALGLGHHLARGGGRHVDLIDGVGVEIVLGRIGTGGGTSWTGHGCHLLLVLS